MTAPRTPGLGETALVAYADELPVKGPLTASYRQIAKIAVEKLDTISRSYAPTAAEAPAVRAQLEGALKSLGH